MICRLNYNFSVYDIIDFLLTNGIPFHTLQPSRTVLRRPNIPRPCLSPLIRSDLGLFSSRDYLAYRDHCHSILNHPRGRAALMHGHFIWRIALRSVLWETVFSGPSGWSTDADEMIVVQDPFTNTEFIDDRLSTAEQEALCGTYHCLTGKWYYSLHQSPIIRFLLGKGNQIVIKSWYMPPHMFEKSMLNLGRWSTHSESLFDLLDRTFTDHDHEHPSITRGPLSRSQWNDRARAPLDIKKARMRVEIEASKLFNWCWSARLVVHV